MGKAKAPGPARAEHQHPPKSTPPSWKLPLDVFLSASAVIALVTALQTFPPKRTVELSDSSTPEAPKSEPPMNQTADRPQPENAPIPAPRAIADPTLPPPAPNPSSPDTRERRTSHSHQTPWQTWAIAIAVIIVAAWIAFLYYNQLGAMLASNRMNRQALTSVQRAFLFVDDYTYARIADPAHPDQVAAVEVLPHVKNSGTTQARYARYHSSHWIYPLPKDFSFPDLDDAGNVVSDGGTPGFFPPQSGTTIESFIVSRPLNDDTARVVSYGWIKYRDVFEGTPEHQSLFCNELTIIFPSAKGQSGTVASMPCARHNCTDEECKGEK
jgi:hypothetical protein